MQNKRGGGLTDQVLKDILLEGASRHIRIRFPNSEYEDITSGVLSESMSLDRVLNSATDLNFGECNASKFEVEIADVADITGLKIQVYELVDGYESEVILFTGIVDSAKIQPERATRKIVAYDELYSHSDDNVSEWYDSMFTQTNKPEYKGLWSAAVRYVSNNTVQYDGIYYQYLCGTSDQFSVVVDYDDDGNAITVTYNAADYCVGKTPEQLLVDEYGYNYIQQLEIYNPYNYGSVPLKTFRTSLIQHEGIQQKEVTLINDDVLITKTLDSTELKFSDCIKAVCQMTACFGHISANGVFDYIYLGGNVIDYSGNYKASKSTYEEFVTKAIDSVRIYNNAGEVAVIYGAGSNYWNLQNNFLLYGLSNTVLNEVALALYTHVSTIVYTPANLEVLLSLPVEMGDKINVTTHTGEQFSFYALKDSLSGGQLTSQTIQADGSESRNNSTTLSAQLALLESKTTAIMEKAYQKIIADSAEIKSIYGDLANYKVVVAENIQAIHAEIRNLDVTELTAKVATIESAYITTETVETILAQKAYLTNADIGDLTVKVAEIDQAYISGAAVNNLLANYATIDLANVQTGSIKTAMIDIGAVNTAQIADGSITDAKIVELTANKITAGILSVERLEIRGSENSLVYALNDITGALQAKNVDTLNGEILTPRSITADKIVANSITGNEIAAKTITANNIVANSITGAEIAANAITSANIKSGSVTTEKLAVNAVTAEKIDVEDLFSQYITATNLHITGDSTFDGILNGATGSFSGNVTAATLTATKSGKIGCFNIGSGSLYTDSDENGQYIALGESNSYYVALDSRGSGRLVDTSILGGNISIRFNERVSGDPSILLTPHVIYTGKHNGSSTDATFMVDAVTGNVSSYGTITAPTITATTLNVAETITAPTITATTLNATRIAAGLTPPYDNSIGCSNWFRSSGDTGWYSQTYGGGWYMTDTVWLRSYGNKGIYTGGSIQCENGVTVTVCPSTGQYRLIHGNYGVMLRNDGSKFYILSTSSSDSFGSWNSNRPFTYDLSDASVTMNNVIIPTTAVGIRPTADNTRYCGSTSYRWSKVYSASGVQTTSDERDKAIIGTVDDRFKRLYMMLEPIMYHLNGFGENKINIGFGAQTTEEKAISCGISPGELGMLDHEYWDEPSEDGRTDRYGMYYNDIAALSVQIVQEHESRLDAFDIELASVQCRQDTQEAQIESLQEQLADARMQIAAQAVELAELRGQLAAIA